VDFADCQQAVISALVTRSTTELSSEPGQRHDQTRCLTCCSPRSILGHVRATFSKLWIGERS
jgi:hypothetical protein